MYYTRLLWELTKAGKPFGFPTPLGWKPLDPEGIIMFNLSGKDIAETPVNLDFELTRPKGWKSEKPASMLKDLIELTTKEGEVILDPFTGSGVTIAEAVRAGRKAVGIELEEKAIKEHIIPKVEEAAKEIKSKKEEAVDPLIKEIFAGTKTQAKNIIKDNPRIGFEDSEGILLKKISNLNNGINKSMFGDKPQLKYGGYYDNVFTDAYVLIKDPVARDIYNDIWTKDAKKEIKKLKLLPSEEVVVLKEKEKENLKKAKETKKDFPSLETVIPKEKGVKAKFQGIFSGSNKEIFAVLTDGKKQVLVNPDKLAFMNKFLPDAEIRIIDNDKPVLFKKNGKLKGLLMPIRVEGIAIPSFTMPELTKKISGRAGASIGDYRDGTEIKLGDIDKIRPIEFPELVELARELTGIVPKVATRFKTTRGMFHSVGDGMIRLSDKLFKKGEEQQLASTLAHELGHLTDYFPHKHINWNVYRFYQRIDTEFQFTYPGRYFHRIINYWAFIHFHYEFNFLNLGNCPCSKKKNMVTIIMRPFKT